MARRQGWSLPFLLAGLLYAGAALAQLATVELNAGMYLIRAEVAADFGSRARGLMYRETLAPNAGMLFVFEADGAQCMWMKNTLIPLSVAFLDVNGQIINIADMTPHSEQSHCAARPARYALEMNRGSVEFKLIAPIGASTPRPVGTEQGFMYVEAGTKRIIGLIPTGQVQIPWEAADISAYWTELMTGPRALAADIGITDRPERYGYVIQDDGSVAVMRAEPAGSDVPLGWTPWTIENASVRSMFAAGGSMWAIIEYEFDSVTTWVLLEFDDDLYLDLATQFAWVTETDGDTIETVATGGNFGNQPANDGVELISDNAADTTQTWTIIGTTNGGNTVVVETGTLNGTSVVSTTKTDWGVILAVKLSATAAGTVTVREASADGTIITLTTGQTSKGVTAVDPTADQAAFDVNPTVVAGGASTKVVGIKYTEAFGTDVRYQAATLNGTTAATFPYPANTVTEVYNGDVATATAITVKVGATDLSNYASGEVEVMSEGHWRHGEFEIDSDGDIQDFTDFPDGTYIAGFDMMTRLTFLPPTVEHPAYEDGMRHSVPVARIKVKDASTYSVNSVLNPAYRAGEDTDEAPTLRTETKRWGIMGRGETLAPDITQTIPSPLIVLGAQMRVNF